MNHLLKVPVKSPPVKVFPLLRLEINRGADCAGGVVAYYAVAVQSAEPHVGAMRLNQCPLTIVIDFA